MDDRLKRPETLAGIVMPAHNESRSIARSLSALTSGLIQLEIVVVCNGCTDDTAAVARMAAPSATVIESVIPCKGLALRTGDQALRTFPRIYIDADVELSNADVKRLIEPLLAGKYLATGPVRRMPRDGVSWLVRSYYDVWERLPQVKDGLFGRGVIALSEQGNERVRLLPQVMSDDLAMSEAFAADERAIVSDAVVVVRPPKKVRDLIRRRVRVATGNAEADEAGLRSDSARTSAGTLWGIIVQEPSMLLRMPSFVGITLVARVAARRAIASGDFTTWQRDESSRE